MDNLIRVYIIVRVDHFHGTRDVLSGAPVFTSLIEAEKCMKSYQEDALLGVTQYSIQERELQP